MILDLMKMEFSKCKFKTPNSIGMAIILDNIQENELLMNGFVRRDIVLLDMNIPLPVISSCGNYHSVEYIHGMDQKGKHWKIRLSHILDNRKNLK